MAKVSVTINNRKYEIACDDGQEAHLSRLAQYVDRRVDELVAAVGQVGDARLLVMASLLVADELSEVYTELDALRDDPRARVPSLGAADLDRLAERIENIAGRLE
ncbi:MAG: cell division protein ZapA [Rhodospirillales bacterium]|jgi:cell division protein ZapA|nr:cell division protein ZapA [Rhodospirillaceae bacterium]MDP6428932.1 cell division protein ZapA [Rhodospirillales bacterium]MDP6644959.1 cell division protein ZapA [Rhodospirillales bacterium]MDP6840505.1 cell division protein ZapA [Rhodospirillales bacterium]|tara:strand:- start:1066 stop:1380 length:315 start_codon:yes stop_codon:yes gene_type:complete